jgi:hypothetical protein
MDGPSERLREALLPAAPAGLDRERCEEIAGLLEAMSGRFD